MFAQLIISAFGDSCDFLKNMFVNIIVHLLSRKLVEFFFRWQLQNECIWNNVHEKYISK